MKAIVQDAYGPPTCWSSETSPSRRSVMMRCWSAYTLLAWIGAFGT